MRRLRYLGVALILALALAGCGDDDDHVFVAQILSDQQADGDIAFYNNALPPSFVITNGPDTLFFGIDDLDPNFPEYRAFLDFPLDGSAGGDVVPGDARIRFATIELFINEVSFASVVPTLIDLVVFPINGLRPEDYDSDPLRYADGTFASRSLDFYPRDIENYVLIDITPLLVEAQRRGLPDFQVRFLLDFLPGANGFVGIEDQPQVTITAPLLTVEYE